VLKSASLLLAAALAASTNAPAVDPMAVRFTEGLTHGFLALTTLDGRRIAYGDLIQTARGFRVTSRLVFHFADGSLYDDTTVFTQRQRFRLISDHVVLKGPSFPKPRDVFLDAVHGQLTVSYTDDGQAKKETFPVEVPPDASNGMLLAILKSLKLPRASGAKVSLVAATPKPRVVQLAISSAGDDVFTAAGSSRNATHYVIKVEIGGLAGVVAPLVGKQPPDSHVWIYHDGAPGFVKAELPLYDDGPLWRIVMAAPAWPRAAAGDRATR